MGYGSYISGQARGQDLVEQLLARGFSKDNDGELFSPAGEYTGVFAKNPSTVEACEDWRTAHGFASLVQALHEVEGLEEAWLERQGEDPDDKEGCLFDGDWHVLVSVEEYVLEDQREQAVRAAQTALESFLTRRPAVFRPYPNPDFVVEILQTVGGLHLVRERLGDLCFGLQVVSWEPQDAAPDPERPGYQVALPDEALPKSVFKFRIPKRIPRQRRSTAVLVSVAESCALGHMAPEGAAWLLARLGFDPAPLWAEIEAAGWKSQTCSRDEFGGGLAVVSAKSIEAGTTPAGGCR